MPTTHDAIVVGGGPNGLVAANLLADAGWSVLLLEAQHEVGGAVRSDRELDPDFVHDTFSAFYPLGAASPVLEALGPQAPGDRPGLLQRRAEAVDDRAEAGLGRRRARVGERGAELADPAGGRDGVGEVALRRHLRALGQRGGARVQGAAAASGREDRGAEG